jgi:8-oxo-dGTP pyrophosphatase MutT (NUDIX family)
LTDNQTAFVRVASVQAEIAPFDWAFVREHEAAIDAEWARMVEAKPATFNGRILLQHRGEVVGDRFACRYFETDYRSFIGWLRLGHPPAPGATLRNGFAMAALRARDGAYLLGVMGAHTVNAGKIYFAAGTPDRDDLLPDGTVDLAGSTLRELEEETGLTPDDVVVKRGWTLAFSPHKVALLRDVRIDLPADEARALMLDRIARQDEPELADIAIVRGAADIDPARMPPFMQDFLRDAFRHDAAKPSAAIDSGA